MNWGDLGKKIAGFGLTALGTVLGGPLGAAAGGMAAKALGLSGDATPDAVAQAIDANPANAQIALAKLNAEHEETMAAYAAQNIQIQQTGQTTRAAYSSADPYVRRAPATWLYVTAAAWILQSLAIVGAIVGATVAALEGDGDAATKLLNGVEALAGALTAQWTVALSVLGVGIFKHSRDKLTEAGHKPAPGLLSTFAAKLTGGGA